ncbi:MAG: MaoC family dehydratase [Chloroflexi bacterium]|nr:MaoC family dehydratase [Chloroflexota bacterium]
MSNSGLSFASLEDFVGSELGISDWMTVDQRRIDAFADVTQDHQWIHTDPERAAESTLGSTIAHGYLTLSLLSHLQFEIGAFPVDVSAILNYGLDRVRFLTPVKEGQRIRARLKLLLVETRPDGRKLMKLENTVEIEGNSKPALIAETLNLLIP